MTEDIIARIGQAVGCQYCGRGLREDGPSSDFCGEPCQMAWRARLARPLPAPKVEGRAALLHDRPSRGYTADVVIVDEVTSLAEQAADSARGERVAEFCEQVLDVELAPWQRGWLASWFRRHR